MLSQQEVATQRKFASHVEHPMPQPSSAGTLSVPTRSVVKVLLDPVSAWALCVHPAGLAPNLKI